MLWVLVAGWLLQGMGVVLGQAVTLRLLRRPQPWPEHWPPILVVVPVRGPVHRLERFLRRLAAQDHPDWRVVFAVEAATDQAVPALAAFVAADPGRRALVVAGVTARRGQKVHNLLAGLAALRAEDAALVTLDADQVPPPGMLRALLRPLLTGQGEMATGYRWSLPADGRVGSLAVAWADAALAALPRPWPRRLVLCWGGATAIGRDALVRLDLPVLWDRAVADDSSLSRAAVALGLRVAVPLGLRSPSPAGYSLREGLTFGTRQYRLVRLHAPRLWAFGLVTAALPLLGLGAALALPWGWVGVLAAAGLAALAARQRRRIAAAVLPAPAARLFARMPVAVAPLAIVMALAAQLRSAVSNRIAWADRTYRVATDGDVTVEPPAGG